MADRAVRKQTILDQVTKLAQKLGVSWNEDHGLLDEVTGLVEYPVVLEGNIDTEFMGLPKELMISVMKTHQRYFTFSNTDGALAPYFGIVANNLTAETDGTIVRHGNEKVCAHDFQTVNSIGKQIRIRRLKPLLKNLKPLYSTNDWVL